MIPTRPQQVIVVTQLKDQRAWKDQMWHADIWPLEGISVNIMRLFGAGGLGRCRLGIELGSGMVGVAATLRQAKWANRACAYWWERLATFNVAASVTTLQASESAVA